MVRKDSSSNNSNSSQCKDEHRDKDSNVDPCLMPSKVKRKARVVAVEHREREDLVAHFNRTADLHPPTHVGPLFRKPTLTLRRPTLLSTRLVASRVLELTTMVKTLWSHLPPRKRPTTRKPRSGTRCRLMLSRVRTTLARALEEVEVMAQVNLTETTTDKRRGARIWKRLEKLEAMELERHSVEGADEGAVVVEDTMAAVDAG